MNQNINHNNNPKQPQKKGFNFYWIYIILIAFFVGSLFFSNSSSVDNIDEQKLLEMVRKGEVDRIDYINDKEAEIYLKDKTEPSYSYSPVSKDKFLDKIEEAEKDNQEKIDIRPVEHHDWFGSILSWIFPLILIFVFWFVIMRMMGGGAGGGAQIFNVGKSKATLYDSNQQQKTTFKDVAGLEEAKEEVMEIVDFLKNPKRYTKLGGKIPKGVLLVGPPGTGKTLLAKSVAGEASVPFFSMSGSDFVEMFVGVGASRVRDLFAQAKEKAPCIVFIDEIDAIGRARGKAIYSGGNDERESTLNQLLTEMDGFGTNSGVIILAATNRADILDRALLRAGRFDRQIYVELPDLNGRREIFQVHMRNLVLDKEVSVEFLAKQTPGFSGADIANVCNEAALIAARHNKEKVTKQDFLDAIDRIIGGLEKKNSVITASEKKTIAFHEAGHATTSWMLQYAHPLVKVTIVPRGKALGAAWYLPDERQITTKEQMFHEMIATLGGRAAEQTIFGTISTGALNDLEKVSKQAYAMVAYYGLDETLGNISYYDSTGQQEYNFGKPYSEKTAQTIDQQVSQLIEKAYNEALRILQENREGLTRLAEKLIDQEVIFSDDLEEIFGKRPWVTEERNFSRKKNNPTENQNPVEEKDATTTSQQQDDEKPQQIDENPEQSDK